MGIHWRLLLPWLSRAWPVLALIPVAAIHGITLAAWPAHASLVNKIVGMVLQVGGALLVLISIDENLGMFRGRSLWAEVLEWVRSFPLVRPPGIGAATGSVSATASGTARVSVDRHPTTLEERIEQLERHLGELRKDVEEGLRSVRKTVEDVESRLQDQITVGRTRLEELTKRVESATVGGFKMQALGVLLALYGAITSVFA